MDTVTLHYHGGRPGGEQAIITRTHGMGLQDAAYWANLHGVGPLHPGDAVDLVAPSGHSYHFSVGYSTPVPADDAPFFLEHPTRAFTTGDE